MREWLWSHWWWLAAALGVASVVLWVAGSLSGGAGTAAWPPCTSAQLRPHMGPNHRIAGGRVQTALLTLTNVGPACTLDDDIPLIQPVTGPRHRHVGLGDVPDLSRRPPVSLRRHQSASSLISVVSLPPVLYRTCRPTGVTGLVIRVGAPAGASRYVAHGFSGVCSNRLRDNVGAAWYTRT